MRLKTTNKLDDVKLAGITVSGTVLDKRINRLTFTDSLGGIVQVSMESYSLVVAVPEPPSFVKRFFATGIVGGKELTWGPFEHEYQVGDLKGTLPESLADSLKVEEREVEDL